MVTLFEIEAVSVPIAPKNIAVAIVPKKSDIDIEHRHIHINIITNPIRNTRLIIEYIMRMTLTEILLTYFEVTTSSISEFCSG